MIDLSQRILKKHHLSFIPQLRIDPELLRERFSPACSMCHCNGTCCREGVLLDIKEKEQILANAELIKRYLEPQQEHDELKWFDQRIEFDKDFPSGKCDGTAVRDGGCVFQDKKGLCTLQKAATAEGMNKFALKPYFCVAFPLVIDEHTLTIDDPDFTNRTQCCSTTENGTQTIVDICSEELEFMLGAEGRKEVEALFQETPVPSLESTV